MRSRTFPFHMYIPASSKRKIAFLSVQLGIPGRPYAVFVEDTHQIGVRTIARLLAQCKLFSRIVYHTSPMRYDLRTFCMNGSEGALALWCPGIFTRSSTAAEQRSWRDQVLPTQRRVAWRATSGSAAFGGDEAESRHVSLCCSYNKREAACLSCFWSHKAGGDIFETFPCLPWPEVPDLPRVEDFMHSAQMSICLKPLYS
jgi:hypothetical protein